MNNTIRILLVDDDATQRNMIREILEIANISFDLHEAANGQHALDVLQSSTIDVVLLDKRMPGMTGDEVLWNIRNTLKLPLLPIIMVTGTNSMDELSQSFAQGATDFIRKPYDPPELIARLMAAVNTKRLTDQLDDAESLLFALARMVESKDETTGDHCYRLSHRCVAFGKVLGLSPDDLEALRKGGVLHDIGKLGIPDSILMKNGKLDEAEWEMMRHHPEIGAKLCEGLATMRDVVPIIRYHHERWDGSGYPHGLAGHDIPLLARVFQIIDIYDALASERPYKPAFSQERIIEIFHDEAARGWRDPELVRIFLDILINQPALLDVPHNHLRSKDEEILEHIASTGVLQWDSRKQYA